MIPLHVLAEIGFAAIGILALGFIAWQIAR